MELFEALPGAHWESFLIYEMELNFDEKNDPHVETSL